jgi:hypothetical protein
MEGDIVSDEGLRERPWPYVNGGYDITLLIIMYYNISYPPDNNVL